MVWLLNDLYIIILETFKKVLIVSANSEGFDQSMLPGLSCSKRTTLLVSEMLSSKKHCHFFTKKCEHAKAHHVFAAKYIGKLDFVCTRRLNKSLTYNFVIEMMH